MFHPISLNFQSIVCVVERALLGKLMETEEKQVTATAEIPPQPKRRFGVRFKAITAVAIAAMVVVLSSSFTGYKLRKDSLLEEFQIFTKSVASTGALGLYGDDLKNIKRIRMPLIQIS